MGVKVHIQICSVISGWHNVDEDMARRFVTNLMGRMTAIPEEERVAYIEAHHLKGITVKELIGE